MIIERRRYSVVRGQMDRMHQRMQHMLLPMFAQHGIPLPIAMWEDRDGGSILTWMIEWPSFETRQALWANFYPHFYAARALETGDEFVTRTDLTLIAPWPERPFVFPVGQGICESAWHPQPPIGQGATFRQAMNGPDADIFQAVGALAVQVSDIVFGPLPMAMVIVSWSDAEARNAGMARLERWPVPERLAGTLDLHGSSLTSAGLWEDFDRISYLPTWRLG